MFFGVQAAHDEQVQLNKSRERGRGAVRKGSKLKSRRDPAVARGNDARPPSGSRKVRAAGVACAAVAAHSGASSGPPGVDVADATDGAGPPRPAWHGAARHDSGPPRAAQHDDGLPRSAQHHAAAAATGREACGAPRRAAAAGVVAAAAGSMACTAAMSRAAGSAWVPKGSEARAAATARRSVASSGGEKPLAGVKKKKNSSARLGASKDKVGFSAPNLFLGWESQFLRF